LRMRPDAVIRRCRLDVRFAQKRTAGACDAVFDLVVGVPVGGFCQSSMYSKAVGCEIKRPVRPFTDHQQPPHPSAGLRVFLAAPVAAQGQMWIEPNIALREPCEGITGVV